MLMRFISPTTGEGGNSPRMSVLVEANSVLGGRHGNKPKKLGLKTQHRFSGVQGHPPSLLSHSLGDYLKKMTNLKIRTKYKSKRNKLFCNPS